jgi:cyanophycinase
MFCQVCRLGLASALVLVSATLTVGGQTRANDNILQLPAEAVKNRGTLIIVGGGCTPPEAKREFVRLAGGQGARIVIVPACDYGGSQAARQAYDGWLGPVASLEAIDTNALTADEARAFEQVLDRATGVWMGGGSQNRLMGLYGRTRVEQALHRLLERGGVIGGNSAGAAVMSRVMICHGWTESPTVGRGFGLISGAVVDQHFSQRNRETRLLGALRQHADLIGLGVDERTALIVSGNQLRVVGENAVFVYPAGSGHRQALRLNPGEQADLAAAEGRVEVRVASAPRRRQ